MKRLIVSLIALLTIASAGYGRTLKGVDDKVNDIRKGRNNNNQLETLRVSGNGTVGGTLDVDGALTANGIGVVDETSVARTSTSTDYGKLILINTNAAVAITLPANGAAAGVVIEYAVHGAASDACAVTISAATADTLIGPNDVDLDSVTWATGHRIGAHAKFWSDGSFWHVLNLGGTTITYTD